MIHVSTKFKSKETKLGVAAFVEANRLRVVSAYEVHTAIGAKVEVSTVRKWLPVFAIRQGRFWYMKKPRPLPRYRPMTFADAPRLPKKKASRKVARVWP